MKPALTESHAGSGRSIMSTTEAMHGEDDQIVPVRDASKKSARLRSASCHVPPLYPEQAWKYARARKSASTNSMPAT